MLPGDSQKDTNDKGNIFKKVPKGICTDEFYFFVVKVFVVGSDVQNILLVCTGIKYFVPILIPYIYDGLARVNKRFAIRFAAPFTQYLVVPSRVPVNSDEAFADLYSRPELGWFAFVNLYRSPPQNPNKDQDYGCQEEG